MPDPEEIAAEARTRVSNLMTELGVAEKIVSEDWRALSEAIVQIWADGANYGADAMKTAIDAAGANRV